MIFFNLKWLISVRADTLPTPDKKNIYIYLYKDRTSILCWTCVLYKVWLAINFKDIYNFFGREEYKRPQRNQGRFQGERRGSMPPPLVFEFLHFYAIWAWQFLVSFSFFFFNLNFDHFMCPSPWKILYPPLEIITLLPNPSYCPQKVHYIKVFIRKNIILLL